MARARSGVVRKKRVNKVLKQARGYRGRRSKLYRSAKMQVIRSGVYAYRDRRRKKRDFRRLWIVRINAACKMFDMTYSRFMNGLKKAKIALNRKILSNMAVVDLDAFKELVDIAKKNIA